MKTENRQRELAFLHYLNALDSGDIEAISHFLEQVEEDEILEQMMIDYHEQDQNKPEEPPVKTIIPFKLKREQIRRMMQIAGIGSVAALALITVGMIGILLGMRYQEPKPVADAQHCNVTLANEDNTVNLIAGDDIETPIHVGVNNPFTVYLNTGEASEGYQVIFEGLRAIMAYDDLLIEGDCSEHRVITVYPQGQTGEACEIEMEPVQLPLNRANLRFKFASDIPIVFDHLVEDAYPIVDSSFEGLIPAVYVRMTDGCINYPLLYVPPRFGDKELNIEWNSTSFMLGVDKIRVREQRFENGIMLYIEAIDEVWVAYHDMNGIQRWRTHAAERIEANRISKSFVASEGLFAPEQGLFSYIWEFTGYYYQDDDLSRRLGEEIGWAISEPITYMASYDYPTSGGNIEDWYHHFIETSTGEVYEFFPNSQYYPSVDAPEWRIVNDDE